MVIRILIACALLFSVACKSSTPAAPGTPTPPSPIAVILCPLESSVVNTVVVAIASGLQCSNQAAILASVNALPVVGTICASPAAAAIGKPKAKLGAGLPLKSVGSDLCTTIATGLLTTGANAVIPSAWGCTGANAEASLQGVVNLACLAVFPN